MNYIYKVLFGLSGKVEVVGAISSLLQARYSLNQAFDKLIEHYSKKKKTKSSQYVFLVSVRPLMARKGTTFSDAVEGWFTPSERSIIAAYETSGDIVTGLNSLNEIIKDEKELRSMIVKGFTMPFLMVSLFIGLNFFIYAYGVPFLSSLLDFEEWDDGAMTLYEVSKFFGESPLLLLFKACLIIFFVNYIKINIVSRPIRRILDKIPPFSFYKKTQAISFLQAYTTLLHGGKETHKSALLKVRSTSSKYLKIHIDDIQARLSSSKYESCEAFNVDLFGKHADMIELQGSGEMFNYSLEEGMKNLKHSYRNSIDFLVKFGSLGIMIGIIIIMIITMQGFYEIMDSIGQ
ncbi:type II secretion system F family protein [Photobacterium leiognathi]|uniref:type II secretion system F family protein n=1 Tax=Photobacterium leiognathi TaxID=553611 RepID=UPI0029810873|nr:type II secretion system F family protein [Photobacterium leiognathi]